MGAFYGVGVEVVEEGLCDLLGFRGSCGSRGLRLGRLVRGG